MLTPMQIRIHAAGGGILVALKLNPDLVKSSYDPSAPAAFQPAPDGTLNVYAIFEKNPEEGQAPKRIGKLMFYSPVEIPAISSDDTRAEVLGSRYLAKLVRPRHYRGQIDGYSMDLMVG